jgi:hypothetical protein
MKQRRSITGSYQTSGSFISRHFTNSTVTVITTQLLNIFTTSMDVTQSIAMALVQLSSLPQSDKPDVALTLPSPDHSEYDLSSETMDMKVPGKRLPRYLTSPDDQPTQTEGAMQLKIGTCFAYLPETEKLYHFSGFRMRTSIISPTLLPCNVMCLTNLQTCTINVEVERCARSNFSVTFSAVIPLLMPASFASTG